MILQSIELAVCYGFDLTNTTVLIRFRNVRMSFQYFKSGLTDLRALLVIAALLSLSISSNVGPRLLPLPDVIDRVEEQCEKKVGISRSRGPQAESFREPMMAQRRADREAPPQPLAALPKVGFVSPNVARFAPSGSQQSFFFTSSSVSRHSDVDLLV